MEMVEDKRRYVAQLAEITILETVEFEKMARILEDKQAAVARLDTIAVEGIVTAELSELNRIREIERKRAAILGSLSVIGRDLNNYASLEGKLGSHDAKEYFKIHQQFKKSFDHVLRLNELCRILLIHSLIFIRQNIRILTDDGRRKLVDGKA